MGCQEVAETTQQDRAKSDNVRYFSHIEKIEVARQVG